MDKKRKKVFVAMSGGVDSSVAALLLKKSGYDITGVYMKNWFDPLASECPWKKDIKDFKTVCKKLKITHRIEIFEEQYRNKVVKYLINGYKRGIAPNPDMLCNREIKFKLFLNKALEMGADMIATGHYVIKKELKNGEQQLWQANDKNKDQSYFLALLNQKQLRRSLFPVGKYTKSQVRQIAQRAGLSVYDKKDSQGICFIGKVKFKDFIKQFIKGKQGFIKSEKNVIIGKHNGLPFYTIGQRHGLKIGGGTPYYVVDKIKKGNILIVAKGAKNKALFKKVVHTKNFHWIGEKQPKLPLSCQARIRYGQPLQSCIVKKSRIGIYINFKNNQRAVTPGQFAILYKNNQMLGGGVIS